MATAYDIALAKTQEYFSRRVMELCGQFDLSFFLIEPTWVQGFLNEFKSGNIQVHVLIDMLSDAYEPEDPYFALAKAVKSAGGYVIDDPDLTAVAGHKGLFHQLLLDAGVPVPETVIVRRTDLDTFRLTDEIRGRVGVPFVVKPGWGGGRVGVNLDARSEEDVCSCAAVAGTSDSFLIQKRLEPKALDGHVGWFRIFYVLGEIIPCWWEPPSNRYQLVTHFQERLFKLAPLRRIVRRIARISKIKFFSTEIALTRDSRFLVVDYLNTNCDMHAQTFYPTGVPDEVVRRIAWLLVEHSMAVLAKTKGPFDEELRERDADWEWRRGQGLLVPGE